MAFCSSCGEKLNEGVKFCSGCGSQTDSASASMNQEKEDDSTQAQSAVLPAVQQNQATLTADDKYCFSCGSVIKKAAEICPKCGVNQRSRSSSPAIDVFCASCGKTIKKIAELCPFCGVRQNAAASVDGTSDKDWLTALLLCLFLSWLGVHRFYVGKIGTGILMILVGWLTFGIWHLIDFILICCGKFKDSDGRYIVNKK